MTLMAVDYAHTDRAERYRMLKASELVAALRGANITARTARRFDQGQRRVVERFAHVSVCSDETWCVALNILEGVR